MKKQSFMDKLEEKLMPMAAKISGNAIYNQSEMVLPLLCLY